MPFILSLTQGAANTPSSDFTIRQLLQAREAQRRTLQG